MKYKKEELKRMAKIVMANKDSAKSNSLIWNVCIRTGLLPDQVIQRIKSYI